MLSGTSKMTAVLGTPVKPFQVFWHLEALCAKMGKRHYHTHERTKGTAWRLRDPESHCKQLVLSMLVWLYDVQHTEYDGYYNRSSTIILLAQLSTLSIWYYNIILLIIIINTVCCCCTVVRLSYYRLYYCLLFNTTTVVLVTDDRRCDI